MLEYAVQRNDDRGRMLGRRARWIELPLDSVLSNDPKRMAREARHPWRERSEPAIGP